MGRGAKQVLRSVLVAGVALFLQPGVAAAADTGGAWSERVQVFYQSGTHSVVRRRVRVWDFQPEKHLEFTWEPASSSQNTISGDGSIDGRGTLTWRVRGSASYDPDTIYSTYTGDIKNGRPEGRGRLEVRSGEVLEGHWTAGVLDGTGLAIEPNGDRYEGAFADGLPNGEGRLLTRTGSIFEGTFVNGLKNGSGRTRLPGGTVYVSQWAMGREIGTKRADVLADALVGGLLKADASGSDAGKVEIGVSVDQRMTQRSDMHYQHVVRDDDIAIYPESDEYNTAWNGGAIGPANVYDGMDWDQAFAFAQVDLKTTDNSRVKLDSLDMKVASSEAYRKPMLSISQHSGCVGFRPDFSLVNSGWGSVKDMKMSIRFTRTEEEGNPTGEPSQAYDADVGSFDDGTDVSVKDVFQKAGVDIATLETQRFTCPSHDALAVCRAQATSKVDFGAIGEYVKGNNETLSVTVLGTLDYSWSDDDGHTYQQSEPFQVEIMLAYIEAPQEAAECGDGYGGSPEAMRYQSIEFPIGKQNYSIAMPVRGNHTLSAYTARLKMWSSMSSIHRFSIAAHFADGSTRESKPVTFFFFRPKQSLFESKSEPTACYLPREINGCG